jgi:hypothetical protein
VFSGGLSAERVVPVGRFNVSWEPLPWDRSFEATLDWRCDSTGPVTAIRNVALLRLAAS